MLWLEALIHGLSIGSLYALFALSIVILHRAAGLVNFAHGSLSMVMVFVAFEIMRQTGFSAWQAMLVTLPIAIAMALAVHMLVIQPKRGTDPMNSIFRTFALLLLLVAFAELVWGHGQPYEFPSLFGDGGIDVAGYRVSALEIGAFVTAAVVATLFGVTVRKTRWGLLMRATSSDRSTAALLGVRVQHVELLGWAIAGVLLLLVGMMFASFFVLSTDLMTGPLLKGFTAAILGGLNSFSGAIVGGLVIGVVDAELALYTSPEWQAIVPLAIILFVLLVRPAGIFDRAATVRV